jgi:hypothetical protein
MEAFMFYRSIRVGILPAFLLCAVAVLAQSGAANTYDINVINPVAVNSCSVGEPVSLSGVVHLSYSVITDSNSVNHFSITATNDLTAAGQNTGLAYVAGDDAEYDSNNDDGTADLTVELKSDLKPQGAAVGMTLVQSLHIIVDTNGNISGEVIGNTTSCGN